MVPSSSSRQLQHHGLLLTIKAVLLGRDPGDFLRGDHTGGNTFKEYLTDAERHGHGEGGCATGRLETVLKMTGLCNLSSWRTCPLVMQL